MSIVAREAWKCDVCGFEWLRSDGIVPVQCPSKKCRTRKWNLLWSGEKANIAKSGIVGKETVVESVDGHLEAKKEGSSEQCEKCGSLNGHQKWCKAK